MPQMSPLGWSWMVIFVVFGYFLFLIFFYFLFDGKLKFFKLEMKFNSLFWLW